MAVYLIATLNIHDRERYRQYGDGFMEIFTRHRGKLLSVEESPEALEGTWDFTRTVLLEFPSEEDARNWYDSEDYQALVQHRFAAADGNVVMVRGLEPG